MDRKHQREQGDQGEQGDGAGATPAPAESLADRLLGMARGNWVTQALYAAAQLGIADLLVRRLQSVKEARVQEKNRLQLPGHSEPVRRSIQESIAFLDRQAADLERQITEHIEGTPSLKADKELLTSIPGIGDIAAQQILAELPDVSQFPGAESAAAFAGLAPAEFRSGKSVHKRTRLSKAGSRHLRQAVYFPAVTAIRHNPLVRALYERLVAAGKPRMAAVGAAMRKVLMLAFGVLKTRQPFDPNWASRQV